MKTNKLLSLLSAFTFVGAMCFAGPVFAVPCTPGDGCTESESNDTSATANNLGTLTSADLQVSGTILNHVSTIASTFDVDFYTFTLSFDSIVNIFTFDRNDSGIDTVLSVFDSTGHLIAFNDDDAVLGCCLSHIEPLSLAAGDYFVAVTGCCNDPNGLFGNTLSDLSVSGSSVTGAPADTSFSGDLTGSEGDYGLRITCTNTNGGDLSCGSAPAVPEPASLLLLGSGLAGLALWRRKQA